MSLDPAKTPRVATGSMGVQDEHFCIAQDRSQRRKGVAHGLPSVVGASVPVAPVPVAPPDASSVSTL
jgi:hypothetical protein